MLSQIENFQAQVVHNQGFLIFDDVILTLVECGLLSVKDLLFVLKTIN
jgi:hypothetical protein